MVDPEGGSSEKTRIEHPDASTELDLVKLSLSNAKQQLKIKEKKMSSLKSEVAMLKDLQSKLADKETLLAESRIELDRLRSNERKIQELEQELEKRSDSEAKLMDFMMVQTKQLEQTKIALEESKLVISNFPNSGNSTITPCPNPRMFSDHEVDSLRSELQLTRERLCSSEESERLERIKNRSLVEEVKKLKEDLRRLDEADNTGKRAMEDLAVVLKEVSTEANQAKEKLSFCEREIEKSKSEAAQAKFLMKSMENRYKSQVEEAKREAEKERKASEGLRIEIEESNQAWSEKESMFVNCIKTGEEENVNNRRENMSLRAELSLARQAVEDLRHKETSTASNGDLNEKEPLEIEIRGRDLAGKDEKKSTEREFRKENLDTDVKNSTNKEFTEVKNLKDHEDSKVPKENPKDSKTTRDDFKISKAKGLTDSSDTSNEKSHKDLKTTHDSNEKYSRSFTVAKDRNLTDPPKILTKEPKDHNAPTTKGSTDFKTPNNHKNSNVLKDKTPTDSKISNDPKDLKFLKDDLKDFKIPKDDPKDLKFLKEDLKEFKISNNDPKITKDQRDPKIPKDPKDPKINNLTKLSRNCSLNFKDTIHKPPITHNKDPKPSQNNDQDNALDDLLKGSIFDTISPVSSTKSSTPGHKKSHSLTFDHDRSMEDFEHEEFEIEHEHENHQSSRSRKKPLFRRFGNMLSTKSFIRRDTFK